VNIIGGGIGFALAALAFLTGLGAVATFIALGTQRGKTQKLEESNTLLRATSSDLRNEVGDWKRRWEDVDARATRQQSVIDHLKGEVDTLSKVPLDRLAQTMEKSLEMLAGHHREAMFGQELQAGMLLDLLHMNGDQRDRQTIAQAMRVQGAPDRHG
jgi:hypothetical protein